MFRFKDYKKIELQEFLSDYSPYSYLGVMKKDAKGGVKLSQVRVDKTRSMNFNGMEDVYLGYNPLRGNVRRNKKNVGRLALLYVDLDVGRGENPFADTTTIEYKEALVSSLEKYMFDKVVPKPNYICSSGRGLYLLYKIFQNEKATVQQHKNASLRWERINTFLTDAFEDYCADHSVSTDEARVLRIPGSINSTSGAEVKFYEYCDKIYTLHNIEHAFMAQPTDAQLEKLERVEKALGVCCKARNRRSIREFLDRHEIEYRKLCQSKAPSEKQLKYAQDMAKTLNKTCPKFRTAGGADRFIRRNKKAFESERTKQKNRKRYLTADQRTETMLKNRLVRIEKLLLSATKDSYREEALFLYRLFALELTGNKNEAKQMMKSVLSNMDHPLPEKEAFNATRSAEKYWESGSIYKIKEATLAERFGLTFSEWKNLVPHTNKNNQVLRREQNRRYYQSKLQSSGKDTKRNEIQKRRELVARLIELGKSRAEICAELGISERTYYSDKKSIKVETQEAQDVEKKTANNSVALSNCALIRAKLWIEKNKDQNTTASIYKVVRTADGVFSMQNNRSLTAFRVSRSLLFKPLHLFQGKRFYRLE